MRARGLVVCGMVACAGGGSTPAPNAPLCPALDADTAMGVWVRLDGPRANADWRLELVPDGGAGLGPEGWLVQPGEARRRLVADRSGAGWVLTEQPTGPVLAAYEAGEAGLVRLFVEPDPATCTLEVKVTRLFSVAGAADPRAEAAPLRLTRAPEGVELSSRPCDAPLAVGPAAASEAAALRAGQAPWSGRPGALDVAAWSDASADGEDTCVYRADVWLDGRLLARGLDVAPPEAGRRAWRAVGVSVPAGRHEIELHRVRECAGERRVLGVSCGLAFAAE